MIYKIKIWVIAVGEPLPINKELRLLRAGMLSEMLASRGHDVTWWTSTVDHYEKELFHPEDGVVKLTDNLKLNYLHGGLYKKNMSINRIINHIRIAKKFSRISATVDKPDVVIVSYPTIELSLAAVKFANQHKIPVIVDFRDLWPDIFYEALPNKLRWLISPLIFYYNRKLKKIVDGADSIIGITNEFKNWALSKGSKGYKECKVFHLSYKSNDIINKLNEKNNPLPTPPFRICFFGTFSNRLDLETVYQAAKHLQDDNVEFVLCGKVDTALQEKIDANLMPKNIYFPGYIDSEEIKKIKSESHMGILPYDAEDFKMSMPNKVGEYLSGGLPILYCLEGATDKFLQENKCGIFYNSRTPSSLIEQINQIKNIPEALNNMNVNALSAYNKHLNSDIVYSNYCNYIEHLAKSKK